MNSEASCGMTLHDRDDVADFGDFFLEVANDAVLERHVAGRAAVAGAVEADLNDAGGGNIHQLDVAAVGLDGGAD